MRIRNKQKLFYIKHKRTLPLQKGKRYGNRTQKIEMLNFFDIENTGYLEFIPDLHRIDIKDHNNDPLITISKLCNWLST